MARKRRELIVQVVCGRVGILSILFGNRLPRLSKFPLT